jgi:hypothetical protein
VSELSGVGLYPAEHRGLRELHATANQLHRHWARHADRLGEPAAAALRDGSEAASALLDELALRGASYEVHGYPAAQGVGLNLAGVRHTSDRFLERNQALRLSVLDIQHVVLLLEWMLALAEHRGDKEWAGFYRWWAHRLTGVHTAVREAVLADAADPDRAIEPADPSAVGRAGARVAGAVGTAGEAIDASPIGRAARKITGR